MHMYMYVYVYNMQYGAKHGLKFLWIAHKTLMVVI